MNKERRAKIKEIKNKLENIKNELSTTLLDEEFSFDAMPEGLRSSMRGIDSEEAIDLINESIEYINNSIECLSNII